MDVSVIIPTLQAGECLEGLLESLRRQSLRPKQIIVVDSSSDDDTVAIARRFGCRVMEIAPEDFGHGKTRNLAAEQADGNVLVFMTQDAIAADDDFLRILVEPIRNDSAAACYGRQLPGKDAPPTEVFARRFNYPPAGHIRTSDDIQRLGVKAFFFSNVASAIDRDAFEAVGKFPPDVITNEDMLLCAKLLDAGYAVAYQAGATVRHWHNYTPAGQFRRYYDIGVFFAQSASRFKSIGTAGEGLRFAAGLIKFLLHNSHWKYIPAALTECAIKLLAFRLGRMSRMGKKPITR